VAQLVEALRYKSEGHGFDSRWCHWNFSLTYFPGGKGGWCIGLTTLPPSCADFLEIWKPRPPATLRACADLEWDCLALPLPLA
jgi:hypothetical protein